MVRRVAAFARASDDRDARTDARRRTCGVYGSRDPRPRGDRHLRRPLSPRAPRAALRTAAGDPRTCHGESFRNVRLVRSRSAPLGATRRSGYDAWLSVELAVCRGRRCCGGPGKTAPMLTPFFDPKMLGYLLTWCATCAGSAGAGIPAMTGIAAGVAGAAAAVGGIPSESSAPNPARGDEPPLPTGDSHVVPAATGPAGLTVTHSDGAVTVTTPDGTTVSATDTGGNTYAAALPDGSILNGNA